MGLWLGASRANAVEVSGTGFARGAVQSTPDILGLTQITSLQDIGARRRADDPDARLESVGAQLFTRISARGQPLPGLLWRITLDTGLIDFTDDGVFGDGRPFGEHARTTALLGSTYLDVQPRADGTMVLRFGKLRPRVGDGAIFDAAAFGGLFDFDLSLLRDPIPFAVTLSAFLPDGRFTEDLKTSPLVNLEVRFPFTFFEVGTFGALFWDDEGAFVPLVRFPAFVSDGLEGASVNSTRGPLAWTGAWFEWRSPALLVRIDGMLGLGRTTVSGQLPVSRGRAPVVTSEPFEERVRLLSGLVKAELDLSWDRFGASPFFLFLTGDDDLGPPGDRTFAAFPSLAPVVPFTSIFLAGTSSPVQQQPSLQNLAPDGSGLIAPGMRGSVGVGPLELAATVAGLFSLFPPALEGLRAVGPAFERAIPESVDPEARLYGVEVDFDVTWFLGSHWAATLESAYFATGGVFGNAPDAYQLLVGIGFLAGDPQL
ncbi:MAG: hypothetical protein ACFB9M_18945 [Myxococcota bacterium]